MEGNSDSYRPQEGDQNGQSTTNFLSQHAPASESRGVQFNTNSFESDSTRVPASEASTEGVGGRQRSDSLSHGHGDEFDASKTLPSAYGRRKGSIFGTPASRDGHVEKNRDRDAAFHAKHSKKFSEKVKDVKNKVTGGTESGHRRGSSKDSDEIKTG